MGSVAREREHGGAGRPARPVHHREPGHRPRGRGQVRRQQIDRTYRSDKLERFVWVID